MVNFLQILFRGSFSISSANFNTFDAGNLIFFQIKVFEFIKYVVAIAHCRVQYGKYFPSFSYFSTYFTKFQASEITAKYKKRGKYLPILQEVMCDNYFIVKCLFEPNVSRVILLTYCIGLAIDFFSNVLFQTYDYF